MTLTLTLTLILTQTQTLTLTLALALTLTLQCLERGVHHAQRQAEQPALTRRQDDLC